MNINSTLMSKFVKAALSKLTGEWVIMGGTVLPLLKIDHRITLDVDIVPADKKQKDQTLELMQVADQLGLPIEAINQAGRFFLNQIPNWRSKLILLAETKTTHIYRPNGTLYVELKIERMSPSDLEDCLEMMIYCDKKKELLERDLLIAKISTKLSASADSDLKSRYEKLKKALR